MCTFQCSTVLLFISYSLFSLRPKWSHKYWSVWVDLAMESGQLSSHHLHEAAESRPCQPGQARTPTSAQPQSQWNPALETGGFSCWFKRKLNPVQFSAFLHFSTRMWSCPWIQCTSVTKQMNCTASFFPLSSASMQKIKDWRVHSLY